MKKIIINEHKDLQDKEIRGIYHFIDLINKPVEKFISETRYKLSMGEIAGLMSRDPHNTIALIDNSLQQGMDRDLDALHIKSDLIRSNMKKGTIETIINLSKELAVLNNHAGYSRINSIEINDEGFLFLPVDTENKIREGFIDAITSDAAKQLYDLQNEAAAKLQELNSYMINNTIMKSSWDISQLASNLFFLDENKQVQIETLNYEMCVSGPKW